MLQPIALVLCAGLGIGALQGCVSDYGGAASGASSGVGTAAVAAGAAAAALVSAWTFIPEREPRLDADLLTYKTSGNLELCLGSSGRESELLPNDRARWTYRRDACRFSVMLEKGRVAQTSFASEPASCRKTLERCLPRY